MPENYGMDKTHGHIYYIPENARINLYKSQVSWDYQGKCQNIKLLKDGYYILPSGHKIHMERHPFDPSWRLVLTEAKGRFCHKPSTVSGGGKSEISKSLLNAIMYGYLTIDNFDQALKKAAEIIKSSSNPLLYGFSNVTCEAQEAGIKLAQKIDGFIDSNASICQGKFLNKAKNHGINLTTITEIINKGDLIILWGANPAETIPRLLNKILFSPFL